LNPPASEALKRMHMLAADPGIVAIMNKVPLDGFFTQIVLLTLHYVVVLSLINCILIVF
jgi:hypothetical protein